MLCVLAVLLLCVLALAGQVLTSMVLAVTLAAAAHDERPEAARDWAICPSLFELARAAVPTAEALHMVLLLLALRSLHRLALLVHDAGARIDELTTLCAADLIDAINACPDLALPSMESFASDDTERHSTVLTIISQ